MWSSSNGDTDAFIAKFNDTRKLTWATFFGGSFIDVGSSVACDPNGDIFVSGYTHSNDIPIKNSGIPGGFDEPSNHGGIDLFIAKFQNNGTQLWTTYFGGSDDDTHDVNTVTYLDICHHYAGSSLAVDEDGYIYVTGETNSADLPVNTTPCTPTCYYYPDLNQQSGSGSDAFLLIFTPELGKQFLTYWGGDSNDYGMGIKASGSNVVFVGSTISTDPKIPLGTRVDDAYFEPNPLGDEDGMIVEISTTDIVGCSLVRTEDVSERRGSTFSVYPVPMTDYLMIEPKWSNKGEQAELVIWDLLGRVQAKQEVAHLSKGSPAMLDVGDLADGAYFLSITVAGRTEVIKLIKQ